ncbi:MAG: CHAT domain-containing protein [Acidobacteriota bacterium]
MESFEFDSYLILFDPAGREIAFSDDSAGFSNACIRRQLPADGEYLLVVCGATADHLGTYWLTVRERDHEPDYSERAATAYYRRGLAWASSRGSRRAESFLNLVMGRYYRERGRWGQAEDCYARSRAAAQTADLEVALCAAAIERGRLMTQRMRYDAAIRELLRALRLSASLRAAEDAQAQAYAQIGDIYRSIGRSPVASVWYRKAAEATSPDGPASTRARVYSSLFKSSLTSDRDEAFGYAKSCLAMRDAVDPVQRVTITADWARVEGARGQPEEALRLAEEVCRAARSLGCRDIEISALSLESLIAWSLRDMDGTIKAARSAAALARPEDEDSGSLRVALQMQASGEMLRGDYQAALASCLKALPLVERGWEREPVPEVRQGYASQTRGLCTQIIRCLAALNAQEPKTGHARMAFDFAERTRCRSLLEELHRDEFERQGMRAALEAEQTPLMVRLSALSRQLAVARSDDMSDQGLLDRLEEDRARLVAQRMLLEARWNGHSTCERANLPVPLTCDQLQSGFLRQRPNTAILVYQLGVKESFLFLLSRSDVRLLTLPDWNCIGGLVRQWRSAIVQQLRSDAGDVLQVRHYEDIAHKLYATLVQPVADHIRGRDLVFVADGVLHELAFESLVTSRADDASSYAGLRYLVEDHAITYAPSVTILVEAERRANVRPPPARNLLLVGDAVFTPDDPRAGVPPSTPSVSSNTGAGRRAMALRAGIGRLPATRQEVLGISELAEKSSWHSTLWMGFDAAEGRLKTTRLSQFRIVHFATHATADPVDGEFSGILLSYDRDSSDEDGLLSAAEVRSLDLDAELVVLSGCSTAAGQRTGAEGVIGLSREFMIAGAERVCASLWDVEDGSTQRLMGTLYGHLLSRGDPPGFALRQVKIELLSAGLSPSRWAAFVLAGAL